MSKKVVLDTSVIVAGVLTSGPAGKILDLYRQNKFKLFISPQILQEIKTTLSKTKITKNYHLEEARVEQLVAELLEQGELTVPKEEVTICRDPFDNHVLSLVKTAGAKFLVTYDKDLLVLKEFATAKIVSPKDFLASRRAFWH